MSKFRITITGNWYDEEVFNEEIEDVRKEIQDIFEFYAAENIQVKVEDEYCIKKNNALDKNPALNIQTSKLPTKIQRGHL